MTCNCTKVAVINRRDSLKLLALGAASVCVPKSLCGQAADAAPRKPFLIPADKKLSPDWVRALTVRGAPALWKGDELPFVGMPVGGIGCGQLYLAGDGRLWLWDIFKSNYEREPLPGLRLDLMTMSGHYTGPVDSRVGNYNPLNGASVDQGFAVSVKRGDDVVTRTLDSKGFPGVTFRGEYPVGRVTYADPKMPVRIELAAFSPFIPLKPEDSALPATILSFTVTNSSSDPVDVDLIGWIQNAVCPYDSQPELGMRHNTLIRTPGIAILEGTIESAKENPQLETHHGFGSMALSLLDDGAQGLCGSPEVSLPLDMEHGPSGFEPGAAATQPLDKKLVGALGRSFRIPPGERRQADFLITWYFPLYQQKRGRELALIQDFNKLSRHYRPRFTGAADVAQKVAADFKRLAGDTLLWNRTWYDSSLPDWLLTRTFLPVDCLATQTFHWFDNGRVWGWEGVDCCAGTCTHVWNYAQAMARLFPPFERDLRERVDYGIGFREGQIGHRGELLREPAIDGQAGTIIRTWREHTMSADDAFLKRVWPSAKKALEFLIQQDEKRDGVLEGAQSHTLDATWVGPIAWISSAYCAALRAGEQMAREMGDVEFAKTCADIAERGKKEIVERLFNGEYFINLPPDDKHINTNKGCHIDQVLGQSWASQLQLPRVLPKKETTSALHALWKYNFAPDAGGYAIEHTEIKGHRIYACRGEAGLVMTTWPLGGDGVAVPGMANRHEDFKTWVGPGGYFDECMTGFEYQVAAHMICEGDPGSELVQHGLSIARAIHDRYAPAKRNPFNEIECSDHYARAMAAYGVFLAACGFEYHGPKGHIGFAPRLTPDDFKAAFTAAEGWGTYEQRIQKSGVRSQKSEDGRQRTEDGRQRSELSSRIAVKYGALRLKTVSLGLTDGSSPTTAQVTVDGRAMDASLKVADGKAQITLADEAHLKAGESLDVILR